jgi:hypothetical protein
MFVNIPLTDHEPLLLFEHLLIPQLVDNILLTEEGPRNFLATDIEGKQGIKMSDFELLQCQKTFTMANCTFVRTQISSKITFVTHAWVGCSLETQKR